MIQQGQLWTLTTLLQEGKGRRFYSWKGWKRIRKEVLRLDNMECQRCKSLGRMSPAEIVHHVEPLKDRPDLALSIWNGESRQLISLCHKCHEILHPEREEKWQKAKAKPNNILERWD